MSDPTSNVIRTGVKLDQPCPDAPDDGYQWISVAIYDEWRLLRGSRKVKVGPDEVAIHAFGETPRVIRTRP